MTAIQKYSRVFDEAVRNYETAHPYWRIEVLVSLIKWGLNSLHHHIEEVADPQVTWNEPFVELHYPVGGGIGPSAAKASWRAAGEPWGDSHKRIQQATKRPPGR